MLPNRTLRVAPALLDASNVLGVAKSLLSGPSWVGSLPWEVLCPVLGEESYGILPMGLQSLQVDGAFISPNGITIHSKCADPSTASGRLKAVVSMEFSSIGT